MKRRATVRISLVALVPLACAIALADATESPHARARLLPSADPAVPGQPLDILLALDIDSGWHTYWRNPGDSGEAPRIDWTLPKGVSAGPLQFPEPEIVRVGPLANYGYSGVALHPTRIEIPGDWPVGEPIRVQAKAHWLVCAEYCIPESANFEIGIPTASQAGAPSAEVAGLLDRARAGLPQGQLTGSRIETVDGKLRLRVPALERGAPESVRFFPFVWGLVEPAAEQPWRIDQGRLELNLQPGETAATADPGGLLAVAWADGTRTSYELTPERQTQPVAASASPVAESLGFPLAVAFAFLGGLILNLMPCVFPVLAIKALSLAGQGGLSFRVRAAQGLAYTAGVLLLFALLGGLLLALRAGGAAVGWGFQLQYPPFVAIMALLFLALGLALAGAVTLGAGLMGIGSGMVERDNRGSGRGHTATAFGTGALAALVAAPCTAPLMGAALGYALTLPWASALAIVLSLGLGLALPFPLLALAPGLARRLPKPGAWMEHLKQGLAFPMLATAAWLLWVLTVQTGSSGLALALTAMLLLALGLWVQARTAAASERWRRSGAAVAFVSLGAAVWLALATADLGQTPGESTSTGTRSALHAEPYSAERLARARAEGRPTLVNMTAAWCISCLANERVALQSDTAVEAFKVSDALYLKGDWTNRDAAITDYLASFGRSGVPLYVYYPPHREPRVLPQILTPSLIADTLAVAPDKTN